ncbi:hypothetical protein ACHAXT_006458 [Thalassiosira profunda]
MELNAVQTATDARVEIWTKPGVFRGYDADPSAWTLWLNATIATRGKDAPTPIPRGLLDPLPLAAGERRAFYVNFPDGQYLRYGNQMERKFYINHDLVLYGKGAVKRKGSFVGAAVAPRTFNGALYYEALGPDGEPLGVATPPPTVSVIPTQYPTLLPTTVPSVSIIPTQYPTPHPTAVPSVSLEPTPQPSLSPTDAPFGGETFTTEFASSATYAGVMFDMEAKDNLEITSIAFNTYKKEPIKVSLYTRANTYVGSDKDIKQWTLVTKKTVMGNGLDNPTYFPEGSFDPILVRRNKRQAFYITAEGPYLRSGKGKNEGGRWKGNSDLVVFEGVGKRFPITDHTFRARLWNGALQYVVLGDIPTLAPSASPTAEPTQRPTPSPTPRSFRLRLYWQKGYYWQESRREMWFCMEHRNSGEAVYVDNCDRGARQQFTSIDDTIRPLTDTSLCLTRTGYSEESPMRLKRCTNRSDQQWEGFKSQGRFELHPKGMDGKCVSQMHHPKPFERIYPEECRKTRDHDTTYWITF